MTKSLFGSRMMILSLIVMFSYLSRANANEADDLIRQTVMSTTFKVGQKMTDVYEDIKDKDPRFKKLLRKRDVGKTSKKTPSFITKYVQQTLGERIKKKAQGIYDSSMKKGLSELKKRLLLRKRDGSQSMTLSQFKEEATNSAKAYAKEVTKKMGKAAEIEALRWKDEMTGQAANFNKNGEQIIHNKRSENGTELFTDLIPSEHKRSLLDPNKMSSHITTMIVSLIITLPFMFLFAFVPGVGVWLMMFATTAIMVLIIQPLINKTLLGYWLWFDDPNGGIATTGRRIATFDEKNSNTKTDSKNSVEPKETSTSSQVDYTG